MSLQFKGVNTRIDEIRRLEFLRPISFRERGVITGATNLETNILKAGTIHVTSGGDVSGIGRLHCKGQISSDVGLSLSEFVTSGRVQAGGPVMASLQGGFVNYLRVGSHDTDYGRSDPYYTKLYDCNLPDSSPKLNVYPVDSDKFHLKITQGSYTYIYNFPSGLYSATEVCNYFNSQLQLENQSPLLLNYESITDVFTITVDDAYGSMKEPARPDFSPSYMQDFYVYKDSLLLQRLGFVSSQNARKNTGVYDMLSTDRILTSLHPTFFKKRSGYSQGFYFGGIKNDKYSEVWSPAMNIWVDSDPSQDFRSRVIKSKTTAQINEQLSVTTLGSSNLVSIEATVTSPFFDFTNSDVPEEFTVTPSETRGQLLKIIEVSDQGSVSIVGTDDTALYSDDGVLQGPHSGYATAHIRSRNPKAKDTGPTIAFEGALSNCSVSGDSTTTTYAAIKAVPTSQLGTSVDVDSGGQIIFMTTPHASFTPQEALRINESQQVFMGAATSRPTEEKLFVKGSTYFDGDTCITGSVAIGTSTIDPANALTVSGGSSLTGNLQCGSLTVDGLITNDDLQTLQTQVNAVIQVLAENYEQIAIVANPEPTFAGIQVTNALKVNHITDPDDTVGSITMDLATFTSASIQNLSVNTLSSSGNTHLTTVHVSSELSGPLATFTSITSSDATITNLNTQTFICSSASLTSASIDTLHGQDTDLSGSLSVAGGIHGTLLSPTQSNITGVGTLVSLDVATSITAASLEFQGICTANTGFDGTILTDNQPNITGLGTQVELRATDGIIQSLKSTSATINNIEILSPITVPQASIHSTTCTDAFISGILTSSTIQADSVSISSNFSAPSGTFTGLCSSLAGFSGTLLTSDQPNILSLGILNSLDVSSTIHTKDLVVDNTCSASTYVGTLLTSYQPYITELGNLEYLNVDGDVSASSINVSGICTAASGLVGSFLSSYHPAITKVGTLETLAVSGNFQPGTSVTYNRVSTRVGINSTTPVHTLDVVGDAQLTSNLYVGGTLNAQGVATTLGGLYTQGLLTSTQGIVGTLVTASQPNITGVGTLTSVNVSGDIISSGSAKMSGVCTASSFVGNSFVGSSFVGTSLNLTGIATASTFSGTNALLSGVLSAGSMKFGSLSTWTLDHTLPNSDYGTSDNGKGYYVFPGGLCMQWGWIADSATQTWSFIKTLSYVFCATVTATTYGMAGNSSYNNAVIYTLSTSSVTIDSATYDGNKMPCFIVVFGKV